jgi:hypothetical protein
MRRLLWRSKQFFEVATDGVGEVSACGAPVVFVACLEVGAQYLQGACLFSGGSFVSVGWHTVIAGGFAKAPRALSVFFRCGAFTV